MTRIFIAYPKKSTFEQRTWAWRTWCPWLRRWIWPPPWWRPPTTRSPTRMGIAFSESASESLFLLIFTYFAFIQYNFLNYVHSYLSIVTILFSAWEKGGVVSFYRFPETVSCTFEDSEIQVIFRQTLRRPQNWIWYYIQAQFRQFILKQMWPPTTSRPVEKSVDQIEGQARPARRKLRWV